ncbi:MAG TPA: hypothetical protein ENN39_07695 [Desulfonatronum sp.]|nr:hypothetical protein [Desulfonatronum sp.]
MHNQCADRRNQVAAKPLQEFTPSPRSILCLDIGSGTQDVLLHILDEQQANCPKFVLPSPARVVAGRIAALTKAKRAIWLYGDNMGGGFFFAVRRHLEQGLPLAAHPEAAFSLGDNPNKVRSMGVDLASDCPAGYTPLHLCDFDPGFWQTFLAAAGLDYPDLILAAAQDHGFHPQESNRVGRFRLWRDFLLQAAGRPEALVFADPPAQLTRLQTLKSRIGAGLVADTGAAAVLGALYEPEVRQRQHSQGVCVVNVGNSHVLGFLLFQNQILGVYEQHTHGRDPEAILADLALFKQGELSHEQVMDQHGHGCLTLDLPAEAQGFVPTYVLGPRRALLANSKATFLAPGGDMMLAGCFGLLQGWKYFSPNSDNPKARPVRSQSDPQNDH